MQGAVGIYGLPGRPHAEITVRKIAGGAERFPEIVQTHRL